MNKGLHGQHASPGSDKFTEKTTPSLQITGASYHLPPLLKELWLSRIFREYKPLKAHIMSVYWRPDEILPGKRNKCLQAVYQIRWKLFNRLMDEAGVELIPQYSRNHHAAWVLASTPQSVPRNYKRNLQRSLWRYVLKK